MEEDFWCWSRSALRFSSQPSAIRSICYCPGGFVYRIEKSGKVCSWNYLMLTIICSVCRNKRFAAGKIEEMEVGH